MASGSSSPGTPEPRSDDRSPPARSGITAADHSRNQVRSALDGLLGDDNDAPISRLGSGNGATSRSQEPARKRRNLDSPIPISVSAANAQHNTHSSGALSPEYKRTSSFGGAPGNSAATGTSGYSPTGGAGRR